MQLHPIRASHGCRRHSSILSLQLGDSRSFIDSNISSFQEARGQALIKTFLTNNTARASEGCGDRMSSDDMSENSSKVLRRLGKETVGQRESRRKAIPMQQPEVHPRQWIPDERDMFIAWVRSEFAAANAIIDSLCHHLRMIGEPGEYELPFTYIQQRRYNWAAVLHMQQYFSIAEVVCSLQQIANRKQQAKNPQLSRTQQVCPSAHDKLSSLPKKSRRGNGREAKQESSYTNFASREEASTSRDCCQESRTDEVIPSCPGALDITVEEESKLLSRTADVQAFDREQTPAFLISAADNSKDSKLALSALQLLPKDAEKTEEKPVKQESSDEFQNACSSSTTTNEEGASRSFSNMDFHFSSREEDARLAMIKVSKSYCCCKQVEGKMINVVEDLEMYENVLNDQEIARLISFIHELQAVGRQGGLAGHTFMAHKSSRKGNVKEVIQFGHVFHGILEDGGKISSSSKDEAIEPIPSNLQFIIDRIIRWKILPVNARPDCCSITTIDEGDHALPDMKHHDLEHPFCTLCLMGDCTMVFGGFISTNHHGDCKDPLKISLSAGSVLILQGNSAHVASHAILASPGTKMIINFAKFLPNRATNPTRRLRTAQSRPQKIITTTTWTSSVGPPQAGPFLSASAGRGHAPMVFKNYNMTTTLGVLPVPTVLSSRKMSQQRPQHFSTHGIQPLQTSTTGLIGQYPPIAVINQGWSSVPMPATLPSVGTGVFFPSNGSVSSPGQPIDMPQLRTGVIMLSSLSQSSPSVPEASGSVRSSSKALRHIAANQFCVDHPDQAMGKTTSVSSSQMPPDSNDLVTSVETLGKDCVHFSTESNSHASKNVKKEQQNRSFREAAGIRG